MGRPKRCIVFTLTLLLMLGTMVTASDWLLADSGDRPAPSPQPDSNQRQDPAPQPSEATKATDEEDEEDEDEKPTPPLGRTPGEDPTGPSLSGSNVQRPASQPRQDAPTAQEQPTAVPASQPADSQEALLQDDRQAPAEQPEEAATSEGGAVGIADGADDDELVQIAFKDKKIEDFIPFIVQWTGKAVIVKMTTIAPQKITIISDKAVTKREAVDLLFQAFRLNSVGVIETDDLILLDSLETISEAQPAVILGPDDDVRNAKEDGAFVIKVFKIQNTKVNDIFEQLNSSVPSYASLTEDINSNQLVLQGDIGLAKRIQSLIDILDVPAYVDVETQTFRLAYADANTVAEVIESLFTSSRSTSSSSRSSSSNRAQSQRGQTQRPQNRTQTGVPEIVGTSDQLMVTVLPQTNSLTVRAEPEIMAEIALLIKTAWDIPPTREGDIFRLYDLKYTDPIKVRDTLQALLESSSGGASSSSSRGGVSRGGNAAGGAGADVTVANIFRIEAYPDSNRLIVISKTPDNFDWLDQMIKKIDQPLEVGLPVNVPLKHASAFEVAEVLNVLLGAAGSNVTLEAPGEGLTGIDVTTLTSGGNDEAGDNQGDEISFPWQGRGSGGDEATEVSAIVGKSRVVPNANQNSLLVLATPEIQEAILEIIAELDMPGRQVMISAVIATVELNDDLLFGLKVGSDVTTRDSNNSIGGSINFNFQKTGIGSSFFNAQGDFGLQGTPSFILQALDKETNVRILQQPRVFTSDNKEALFFNGEEVSIETGSQTTESGSTNRSFEQKAVGIGLNVRPRITDDQNVAMDIEVILSNTSLKTFNGQGIIDTRKTTTSITVQDNQTIVISGIRTQTESETTNKVPLLGDIPLVGALFTSTDKADVTEELLIFITPTIVDNPDDNDSNFNVLERERLEALSQPLKDVVKNPIASEPFSNDGVPLIPEHGSPEHGRLYENDDDSKKPEADESADDDEGEPSASASE